VTPCILTGILHMGPPLEQIVPTLSPCKYHGHERVELYLYAPYEPYGLYRAPVPVQVCTLPYLISVPVD